MISAGRLACAVLVASAIAVANPAHAQPADARAYAEKLFEEGRKAAKSGDCARAIPLFRQSRTAFATRGALYNVALCEEQVGRLVLALHDLIELYPDLPAGDERIAPARQKIASMRPRVARLRITVRAEAPADTKVTVDGTDLWLSGLGADILVDPGKHTVAASSSTLGCEPRPLEVSLDEGQRKAVTVAPACMAIGDLGQAAPTMRVAPIRPPEGPSLWMLDDARTTGEGIAPDAPKSGPSGMRVAGYVVGSVGLVGLGVSGGMGADALSKMNSLRSRYPAAAKANPPRCSNVGCNEIVSAAAANGTVATASFVAGLALVGTGVTLVVVGRDHAPAAAFAPTVGRGGAGMTAAFSF